MSLSAAAIDRYWKKVAVRDGCWGWDGYTRSGYGRFYIGSRRTGLATSFSAHRISYEIHYGPIPEGLFVLHHCDTPICSNPAHLFIGTHAENMDDMKRKGRGAGPGSRRTHCPRGHSYDDANTRMYRGRRHCRACDRLRRSGTARVALREYVREPLPASARESLVAHELAGKKEGEAGE